MRNKIISLDENIKTLAPTGEAVPELFEDASKGIDTEDADTIPDAKASKCLTKKYLSEIGAVQLTGPDEIEFWKNERANIQRHFEQKIRDLNESMGHKHDKDLQARIERFKKLSSQKEQLIINIITQLEILHTKKTQILTRQEEEFWGKILLKVSKQSKKTIKRIPRKGWRKEYKQAVNIMMLSYLKLVVHKAKRFNTQGRTFVDLIQEGNIGLIRGVTRFDSTTGNKIGTYCGWWVEQGIQRYGTPNDRLIKLPYNVDAIVRHAKKTAYSNFVDKPVGWNDMDYEWLTEEMLKTTDNKEWHKTLTPEKVKAYVEDAKYSVIGSIENDDGEEDEYFNIYPVAPNQAGEESSTTVKAFDPGLNTVAEAVENSLVGQKVKKVLSDLTPREEQVIKLRFGIGYDREYTLEEIGRRFNVSRERIRQIENQALNKLRHPARKDKLRESAEVFDII